MKRDRVVAAGLAGVTLLALGLARPHGRHGHGRGAARLLAAAGFLMWAVMTVGMMLPSAAPMILVFAAVNRRRAERGGAAVVTWIFAAGYLLAWIVFSAAATAGQWGLERAAAVSPETLHATPFVGGLILIAAGVYQLTPLKRACLVRRQSPWPSC